MEVVQAAKHWWQHPKTDIVLGPCHVCVEGPDIVVVFPLMLDPGKLCDCRQFVD